MDPRRYHVVAYVTHHVMESWNHNEEFDFLKKKNTAKKVRKINIMYSDVLRKTRQTLTRNAL